MDIYQPNHSDIFSSKDSKDRKVTKIKAGSANMDELVSICFLTTYPWKLDELLYQGFTVFVSSQPKFQLIQPRLSL